MDKKKTMFQGISKLKAFPYIILLLIAGVGLLLFPSKKTNESSEAETRDALEYVMTLENKLSEIIGQLDGVRGCRVMVYVDSSYSYLYATNQQLDYDNERRNVKKELVLAEKDGNTHPIVIEEYLPKISSVAVVMKSGARENESVVKKMLSGLFGLDEERIFVVLSS